MSQPVIDHVTNKAWALVTRNLAARIAMAEIELIAQLEQQAADLQREGKHAQAEYLLAIAHTATPQLEAPRRGRPKKIAGGAQ
jgi:hypothetical protein